MTFSRVGVKEMEKKIAFSEVVDYLYREKKKGSILETSHKGKIWVIWRVEVLRSKSRIWG